MAASINDKITDSFNSANPNVAKVTAGRTAGATTLVCDNLAGWPTVSAVHFSTYQIDTNNDLVAGTQIDWKGVVSGNSVGSLTRLAGATDAGSSIGDVVEMNVTGSWGHDLFTGFTQEHSQLDGTHKAITTTGYTQTTGTFTVPTNAISQAALPLGTCVQEVGTPFSAVATGPTVIPYDDTIPQNTEGDQYMTLSITPKSATNILVIETLTCLSNSNGTLTLISALFQDTTANALAAVPTFQLTATGQNAIPLNHTMVAGTTSATTFKIRGGASGAGTTTFNGQSGNRRFGGITQSYMIIREYKA